MAEQRLKCDIRVNKKKSKQPIDLMSVNVDQIVVSDKFKNKKVLIILLVTKKMKWLNHNILFYLK